MSVLLFFVTDFLFSEPYIINFIYDNFCWMKKIAKLTNIVKENPRKILIHGFQCVYEVRKFSCFLRFCVLR